MPTTTEALLDGLIAECHTIIRDEILPAMRAGQYEKSFRTPISDVTSVMEVAVQLADAVGRLRHPEPPPELRQRITVEKIQSPQAAPVRRLSTAKGEGEGAGS